MICLVEQEDVSVKALALMSFTDQFAEILKYGVCVICALSDLRESAAPYGEAARELRRAVEMDARHCSAPRYIPEGLHADWLHNPELYPSFIEKLKKTMEQERYGIPPACQGLARAMGKRPDLFPPVFVNFIGAGEACGALHETLTLAASLMKREWRLAGRRPRGEPPLTMFLPGGVLPLETWGDLTAYQKTVTLSSLCRSFGALLSSGVLLVTAMESVASILPRKQSEQWLIARDKVWDGGFMIETLDGMGIFPSCVLPMIADGEAGCFLDIALPRAADLLEHDFERREIEPFSLHPQCGDCGCEPEPPRTAVGQIGVG